MHPPPLRALLLRQRPQGNAAIGISMGHCRVILKSQPTTDPFHLPGGRADPSRVKRACIALFVRVILDGCTTDSLDTSYLTTQSTDMTCKITGVREAKTIRELDHLRPKLAMINSYPLLL
jgi:hypothetical protein